MWNAKSKNERNKLGLYLLTTRADRDSRVLYFDLTDTITKPVKIFECAGNYDFYTSLDLYNNDKNFICVGGDCKASGVYRFSSWEKNIKSLNFACEHLLKERYNFADCWTRTYSETLSISFIQSVAVSKQARMNKLEYYIKCEAEL